MRVRVSITGATLDTADRILANTPIEGYSELFSLLLRRYEQDFIRACNGFLSPQPGLTVPVIPQLTEQDNQLSPQPGLTGTNEPSKTNLEPTKLKKTAKQRLMDFED